MREILLKGLLHLNSTMQLYLFSGDSQEEVVEAVVAGSSSDEDDLMQRVKGQKVLATPAVRRIAKENKVNKSPGQLMSSSFVCLSICKLFTFSTTPPKLWNRLALNFL